MLIIYNNYGDIMLKLKELREEYKISQTELAEKLNLSQRTISSYENGINEPDIQTLKDIAKFFNVTVDYLIGFNQKNSTIVDVKQNIRNLDKQQLLNIIEKQIDLLTLIERK